MSGIVYTKCSLCDGKGGVETYEKDFARCDMCDGTGEIKTPREWMPTWSYDKEKEVIKYSSTRLLPDGKVPAHAAIDLIKQETAPLLERIAELEAALEHIVTLCDEKSGESGFALYIQTVAEDALKKAGGNG